MVPTFGRDEPNQPDPEFVKKADYDAKVLQIENALKEKITAKDIPPFPEIPEIPDHSIYLQEHHLEHYAKKEQIPEIPDHNIYALKEEISKDYLKKEDLPEPIDISNLVKKEQIEKFVTKDQLPDLTPYLKKSELPPEKDLSEYAKKEDLPDLKPYLKKSELPPEKDLSEYAKKEDLPKIPDVSGFALKEEVDSLLEKKADKSDLEILAKKSEIPDLKPYIKKENLPDFNTLATKAELELKASIGDMAKKVSIEDMEKYKSAIDESLKSKLNKSETYTRQEVKDRYVKKEVHEKNLENKMDKIALPDFESFAKKSDLDGLVAKECVDLRSYLKKEEVETSYCFVKLENSFRFYDGESHDHEIYLGGRGVWNVQYDTHKKIYKLNAQSNFDYYAPFDGLYLIDYTITVQRDTHIMKPFVMQRIRTSVREVVNWEYFDNSLVGTAQHSESTTRTFIKTATIYLKAKQWVKFSIQFNNRAYNNRKMWLHCIGAQGGYTPTYFSITGTKKAI